MFGRFSTQARDVVTAAAATAGSGSLTPMHLLTAMVTSDRGVATEVLTRSGVTLDAIRKADSASGATASNVLDDDAAILESIGIDLDAVRERLEQAFGEGVLDDAPVADSDSGRNRFGFLRSRFEKDSRKVLEVSVREAIAHKDKRIGAEHILLGILSVADGRTRQALESQVSIAVIRERVEAKMNRAA